MLNRSSDLEARHADHLSLGERVATSAALTAYFVVGYFSIPLLPAPDYIHEPMTAVDRLIPFNPDWVWAYAWALPAATAPAFVIGSRSLFRRAALAYGVAIAVSVALFLAVPATAIALRLSSATLDLADPSQWLVANIYAIDPPRNLFPSLHVSMTGLSAFAVWKANRALGCVAVVGLALVAAAACSVKQHFIVDVAGGLGLAVLVGAPTIGRCRNEGGEGRRGGSRGAVIYVLFALVFYAAIGSAFLGLRVRRCPDITGACLAAGPDEPGLPLAPRLRPEP